MRFEKFKVKDVAFLAIMAALLILCAGVSMPVMSVPLFGLRNMVTAPFYGAFAAITLLKVRRPGALFILIFFNAVVLMMMSPMMFFVNIISAFLTEVIVVLIFKSYESDKAVIAAAGLLIPITLPFTAIMYIVMYGQSLAETMSGSKALIALCCAGTVVLSFVGVAVGMKIGRELKKAGRLR